MRGLTVTLYEVAQTGTNPFGEPVYTEMPVEVANVLVGEPTSDEMAVATALYQKTIKYMLGIPKGDQHNWVDKKVSWTDAYGMTHVCHTVGFPITGIEANIPTPWHAKVRCEDFA